MQRHLLLPLLLWLAACRSLSPTPAPETHVLTFLQLNDVYEIGPLAGGTIGGMARVATLRSQLLAENPHTYTILAGDFLSPSVIGTVKYEGRRIAGAQMVDAMNYLGVDYVTFGNHEFDLKEADLLARIDASHFTWVASNVLHKQGGAARSFQQAGQDLPRAVVVTVGGLRMGIMGLTLDANQPGYVQYADVYATARHLYDSLAPISDLVVAITHLSIDQDRELARQVPGLRLVMGGHEHDHHLEYVGDVLIAKADANAKTAYVHRLYQGRKPRQLAFRAELVPVGEGLGFDPVVDSVVHVWEERAYAAFRAEGFDLNAPVAHLPEPMDGREASVRNGPTNLGVALAHAMYEAAAPVDAAVVNSGSIRIDDQLTGDITEFDILRTLPFGGSVLVAELEGRLLRQLLDDGEANRGTGGYLQYWNIDREGGNWRVARQPLDDAGVYRIAVSDFLLTGQEARMGYFTPANPAVRQVVQPAEDSRARDIRLALVDYLKKQ